MTTQDTKTKRKPIPWWIRPIMKMLLRAFTERVREIVYNAIEQLKDDLKNEHAASGPSTQERRRQFRLVVNRMSEFMHDQKLLPKTLRNKSPERWIRQACRDVWSKGKDGYPSFVDLYYYCRDNRETLFSLAGI